ncbi:hypothetical protein CTI14_56545, partial [Methylobacterium radiotolerans]
HDVVERLMPHLASELLLPGESARRHAVQRTLEAAVHTFFKQLQRGGVALQEMEQEIDKELRLTVDGREHRIPIAPRCTTSSNA